jgi:DNA-binding NtrC family response regulator
MQNESFKMSDSIRNVLLAEGDAQSRELLAGRIRKEIDCVVYEAASLDDAVQILTAEQVNVIVIGHSLAAGNPVALFTTVLREFSQTLPVPVVPLGDQRAIVQALSRGAFAYLNHPYDPLEGVIVVARALTYHDLLVHHEKRGPKIRKSEGFHGIIGESPAMRAIFALIEKLAEDGGCTVLVEGESGTGKELVARAIHHLSRRQEKNFVPINCAAIPEHLLESELFGYRKGAFTGAQRSKMGQIQYADGGTLFLDEIGDMPLSLQTKLLRVLQERVLVPVGGFEPIPVNIRVIAATHQDLATLVAQGRFREDLYHRLNVVPLRIPPLRERPDDIPLLVEKFVQVFNRNRRGRLAGFGPDALQRLLRYPWPGNVRELENLVQRMVILHPGATVGAADLPRQFETGFPREAQVPVVPSSACVASVDFGPAGVDFYEVVQETEDRLIRHALTLSGGNKAEAARLLNLNRTTLLEKLRKKGMSLS